jgi:hypothetical protein
MWVRKETPEPGARIEEGSVPWKVPDGVLNFRDAPLLIGVDPYGDTVFNCLQIERQLPREVAYLRQQLKGSDSSEMLDELERLMAVTTQRPHRYLWFVGD